MKNKYLFLLGLIVVCFSFMSCDNFDSDQEIPSYIRFEGFNVVENPELQQYNQAKGFLTNDITDAWVYVDNIFIGAFPFKKDNEGKKYCSFPILEKGKHKISVRPGVKLNGISATRTEYPFYSYYEQEVNLIPGQEQIIGVQDIMYKADFFSAVEMFENSYLTLNTDPTTDTAQRIHFSKDTACTGNYAGVMYLGKDKPSYRIISDSVYCNNYTSLMLEIDYWCNIPFDIGMAAKPNSAAAVKYVNSMRINPNKDKGWQKMYIVLGKVWGILSYPNTFKFYFSPANPENIENGWVFIDNVKLVHFVNSKK